MIGNTSAGVFNAFNYNFDSRKFGSAQFLPEQSIAFLNAVPPSFTKWAVQDLAALNGGMLVTTDYYQNPVGAAALGLSINANTIQSIANSTIFTSPDAAAEAANLTVAAGELAGEAFLFKQHTDNVAGVTPVTLFPNLYPSLMTAQQVGTELLQILNQTDGIQNSVPMLGSMTSLFLFEEAELANSTITMDTSELANSIVVAGESGNTSSIDASSLNTMVTHIQTIAYSMRERRLADWDFYQKAYNIVMSAYQLQGLGNPGNTLTYLVNNIIGTPSYKSKLASSRAEEAANNKPTLKHQDVINQYGSQ